MNKLKTIIMSAAVLLGMGFAIMPQAEAGSSVQNIMNKLGKFALKKNRVHLKY